MKTIALLISALALSPLAAHAQTGGASYGEHCAACHGERGQGNGANIPALTTPSVQQKSDQALFDFITQGNVSNGMPSWAQLPEAERHALVGFVRALSSGASAAVTSSGAAAPLTAPPPPAPFTDFRYESPGTVRKVTVADLPAPFATDSAGNPPKIVPRPEGAWPKTLPGFKVGLFAEGLEKPRLARTAPNGDVFVAETAAGRIKVFRGMTAEGKAEQSALFIEGLEKPFGIAFYPAGNDPQWIYVADYDRVIRIPYRNGDLKARGAIEKLAEIPGGTGHTTRNIQFAKDGQHFYVSVGSKSNIDDPDTTPEESERADILQFDVKGGDRKIFAYGIRNAVGLAVDPKSGELWCSVNERDGLGDNLVPDYITHVEPGGFYGWPWWYMGQHQDPRHMGKHPELKDKVITPDVVLQPHNASLELTFYDGSQFPAEYQGDIFAAEHGSWNKAVRVGYEVIRVPRHHTARASGEYEDFLTGFVVDNEHVWGRPVGITVAKDGSLLVTDDASGSIWRISYTGK